MRQDTTASKTKREKVKLKGIQNTPRK